MEEEDEITSLGDNDGHKDENDDGTSTSMEEKDERSSLNDDDDGSMMVVDEESVSPAEDGEDDEMDDKVWRVIVRWSDDNDCGVLDSFKFLFSIEPSPGHGCHY